jgi:hypothetical protein
MATGLGPTGSAASTLSPPAGFTATLTEVDFVMNYIGAVVGPWTLAITGLLGGTQTFTNFGWSSGSGFSKTFPGGIAAAAINTPIVVTLSGLPDSDMVRVRAVGSYA